jgi:hypothetical protein
VLDRRPRLGLTFYQVEAIGDRGVRGHGEFLVATDAVGPFVLTLR